MQVRETGKGSGSCHIASTPLADVPDPESPAPNLLLDADERRLRGIVMPPLLTGEFKLLACLGGRPFVWHSTRLLSARVYQREDPSALQLVWKYFSTLRRKLAGELPSLLEVCRRRGYRCSARVLLVTEHAELSIQGAPAVPQCSVRRGR